MQIAEVLLLSGDAIRQHIQDYQETRNLKPASGGSLEKLTEEESGSLSTHLEKHTYLYTKDMLSYINSGYGKEYTVSGLRKWLKRHDFTYKKPALLPGKADRGKQESWIKEYYELKSRLQADEAICFMDGVHFTHNVQLAYGWIKKGVRKEIKSNSGRTRINLSSAVDIGNNKLIIQEDKTLNSESTIAFLEKIEKAYPAKKKIYLFCDNVPYYRNQKVREYLKKSKIELKFLSAYSPNLNPIERVWKWMKERVVYNTYYECFSSFKQAILNFLGSISNIDPTSELGMVFGRKIQDRFSPIGIDVADF